eukprot:9138795-Lingulodinium_polyedra.AAC.1
MSYCNARSHSATPQADVQLAVNTVGPLGPGCVASPSLGCRCQGPGACRLMARQPRRSACP